MTCKHLDIKLTGLHSPNPDQSTVLIYRCVSCKHLLKAEPLQIKVTQ